MCKKLLRNVLVAGIIFLFLGIAVQPITSVNITKIEQVKSDDLVNYPNSEEDCNCNDSNESEFPMICSFLKFLYEFAFDQSPFPVPLICHIIIIIADGLGGCPGIP